MMKTSQQGVDLIKKWEGCRLISYLDWGGIWTVGFGATGEGIGPGTRWTQQQADDRLKKDLGKFEAVLNAHQLPLKQHQYDALISLMYNIGPTAFNRSTLLRKLKANDIDGAAGQFLVWNKVQGKVVKGLVNRRYAERQMFLGVA
jgi:lysozyme